MRGSWIWSALILWGTLLLVVPPVTAQETEWERLHQDAVSLHEQAAYDRAVVGAEKAPQVAESASADRPLRRG